jgi:hypothetical protein
MNARRLPTKALPFQTLVAELTTAMNSRLPARNEP